MTVATGLAPGVALPGRVVVVPLAVQSRRPEAAGTRRQVATIAGDLIGAIGLALCLPVMMLAVGVPFVLGVRLLLRVAGLS
ncbi:MAG: hypothetical protein HOP14_07700 [Acidobacteria bacterium]|nr:hypothetical protein [Acidobacteriota bacterium]